jgi:hypothetical protein
MHYRYEICLQEVTGATANARAYKATVRLHPCGLGAVPNVSFGETWARSRDDAAAQLRRKIAAWIELQQATGEEVAPI